MSATVALVTDSTAMLPRDMVERYGIRVVPLQVVIGARSHDEGVDPDVTAETMAAALREWTPVSTSRPTPAVFAEAFEKARADGFDEVLSVHLSGEMSGTFESAQLAARDASLPVRVVDTRQLGMATGFAVITAAEVLERGGSAEEAAGAALARADATTSLFYVDTLEYLRRGGRIGAAAALFGGALAVKPLLQIADGRVATLGKVRTAAKALSRLEELAVQAADGQQIDLCVAHLASPERAEQLTERLGERLAGTLSGREIWHGELGAVLGAHVGPGMLAVCVSPRV